MLLPELLSGLSATAVSERVWRSDLACYAPFTLAILEPGRHTCVVEWDGEEKAVVPYGEPFMPLVSSSFDSEGVLTKRRQLFQRRLESAGKLDSEVLFDFHRSHGAKAGAYSPCMHRPDAETVSFTWVKVTYDEVEFCYAPGAPCLWNPGELLKLPLLR